MLAPPPDAFPAYPAAKTREFAGIIAVYLPATCETYAATCSASVGSSPGWWQGGFEQAPGTRFAGIRPCPVPPIRIALTTRCVLTAPISSRFGPVTPLAPAALSV